MEEQVELTQYSQKEVISETPAQHELQSFDVQRSNLLSDQIDNSELGSWELFCLHLKLLLRKNYLLFKRNKKITFFQLATPIFFCLLMVGVQNIANTFSQYELPDPKIKTVPLLPKCVGDGCITVGYSIIGNGNEDDPQFDWIHETMRYVAAKNRLKFEKDVKLISFGETSDFFNYLEKHPNQTFVAVAFCTSSWKLGPISVPCQFSNQNQIGGKHEDLHMYSIFFNITLSPDAFGNIPQIPGPKDLNLFRLKLSIDNGLLRYFSQEKNSSIAETELPEIEVTYSDYPESSNRFFSGFDVITGGSFYFFLTPMVIFVVLLIEIVREKEHNLRKGLLVMGLSNNSFWMSWILTAIFFITGSTLILILMGHLCNFDFFLNTPFLILFCLFFIFGLSMICLAFFLSTLIKKEKMAYTISFTLLLIGCIMQGVFSDTLFLYFLFYPVDSTILTYIIKFIFNFYPPFGFSKTFGDIVRITSNHYVIEETKWEQGRKYEWSDLRNRPEGTVLFGFKYHVNLTQIASSTLDTLSWLFVLVLFYGLLTWYFDNVNSSNRGVQQSPLFFLHKSYWIPQNKARKKSSFSMQGLAFNSEDITDSVEEEKQKVLQQEKDKLSVPGIRIVGLSKVYRKYPFNIKSRHDFQALKNIYLEIHEGELLTFLGHNGAGKSTLINCLIGMIKSSSGSSKIFDLNVITELEQIRKLIGYVPQFDILWPEMTLKEHLQMFCQLKRIKCPRLDLLIEEKLAEVGLHECLHMQVKALSGGMKRRLSVAIGSLGNPRVIFMDEPTTGMDVVSKRQVWELIQKYKRGRVFILTTHQMEEADLLSDRIAIIVDGQIKCVGSPLYLKNRFGHGYRVTLVVEPDNALKVLKIMKKLVPKCELVDESGGSMFFVVPGDSESLTPLFKLLESKENDSARNEIVNPTAPGDKIYVVEDYDINSEKENQLIQQLKEFVKDCGLSHTTLEEVFMEVTAKKEKKS